MHVSATILAPRGEGWGRGCESRLRSTPPKPHLYLLGPCRREHKRLPVRPNLPTMTSALLSCVSRAALLRQPRCSPASAALLSCVSRAALLRQ